MKHRRTALLLGGMILLSGAPHAWPADQPPAAPPVLAGVVVAQAKKAEIADRVRGYGMVVADPNDVVAVNAPFASVISEMYARPGAPVDKGQALVALEATAAEAAAVTQAQSAVSYARGDLARQRHLLGEQLATHAQVAQAETALADAEAKLRALESVGAGKARTVLTASTAGVVSSVTADVGQRLAEGAPILMLSPQSAMVVRLGIPPAQADAVKPGMSVRLQDVIDPGQQRTGTVASVSAMIDPTTELRDVLVRLSAQRVSGDPPPAPGSFMKGTIILKTVSAVTVPQDAILLGAKGTYVFVVRNGRAQRVDVTTGGTQHGRVGVTGALKPGDDVVVQGNYELTPGMHVRVVTR